MRALSDIVAIDPAVTYEAPEIALILFHVTPRTFARKRKKLRAEGFPEPITRWGRKLWSGQALLDWINRPAGEPMAGANVVSLQLAANARAAAQAGARRRR